MTMMMHPASSSSDDDSSSSGSSSTGGDKRDLRRAQRRADIEPASSDDDDDDGSSDGDADEEKYGGAHHVSNFDDLPTDDSENESDSDDNDSDDGSGPRRRSAADDSDGEGSSDDDEERIDQEDLPLSERVASRAQMGRRYYTGEKNNNATNMNNEFDEDYSGKKRRAERKSRAIEVATERLREARNKSKGKKQKQNYNDSDDDDGSVEDSNNNNNKDGQKKKKKSKHAPTEMSSKRRDYFARGRPDLNSSGIGVSIGANKYKARDPRMISLSGHLDADVFDKRYGFLDEMQEKEIELLKKRVGAWKTPGKKGQKMRKKLGLTRGGGGSLEDDQEELTRLLQERAERKRSRVVRAAKRSVKQKIRADVASGKRGAYYPKRSELKRMEAEAKYEEIRKRGGEEAVDKAIAKRRKKNVAKEARSMPSHMVS